MDRNFISAQCYVQIGKGEELKKQFVFSLIFIQITYLDFCTTSYLYDHNLFVFYAQL